jgi:hypothetical protein
MRTRQRAHLVHLLLAELDNLEEIAMATVKSTTNKEFAAGGKQHMFTEREAGPQKPGVSSSEGQDGPETKFAKGGSGHMFGKQHAGQQTAGGSAHETSGDGGKFAVGGKGHMFGKQTASTAKAGQSGK